MRKKTIFCIILIFLLIAIGTVMVLNKTCSNDVKRVESTFYDQYSGYSISAIQKHKNYYIVLGRPNPKEWMYSLLACVIREENGIFEIVDFADCELPGSFGFSARKMTSQDMTIVFGGVGSTVWNRMSPEDDIPENVTFTTVRVFYDDGKEESASIHNDGEFLFCLEGEAYINDIIFYDGDRELNKLSNPQYSTDGIKEFNG